MEFDEIWSLQSMQGTLGWKNTDRVDVRKIQCRLLPAFHNSNEKINSTILENQVVRSVFYDSFLFDR